MKDIIHKALSDQVIRAAITVHNTLGPGLLEKLYRKALLIQLNKQGIMAQEECSFKVYYDEQLLGNFYADLVAASALLIETKSVKQLNPVMIAQTLNYLHISGLRVGYLINFANLRLEWRRFVVVCAFIVSFNILTALVSTIMAPATTRSA